MKLLITGGAGKVGQAIVRELLNSAAYEITVLDRTPGPERGPVNYLVGDIQDLGQVMEAMAGAEAVIHLAAIHNPNIAPTTVTYQTNVVGTFNVHHAAFRLGVKRVVSASSNAIVGWSYSERFMPDYLPIDEDHPLRPEDVYGLSKEIGETIARSYARKGLETVMLRPSGVVSPEELEEIKKTAGANQRVFMPTVTSTRAIWPLLFDWRSSARCRAVLFYLSSPTTARWLNRSAIYIRVSCPASATKRAI